jgi:AGZA family xanthine/uracil permease-like MFS transporter
MPFTYSIAYGVIAGVISYIIINGFVWIVDKITFGRITPDYSQREQWWVGTMDKPITPTWIRYCIAKARGQSFDLDSDSYNAKASAEPADEIPSTFTNEKGSLEDSPVAIPVEETHHHE